MSQPVTKVPVVEENTYNQGKGQDAAAEVKVGPAYSGGSLKDNPLKGGGINRALKSGTSE
jgi:hypothetical protein